MPGVQVNQLEDGRTEYVLSQSWLNTALKCPEQARLELVGALPRVETDATAIGTSMHTSIETVLQGEVFSAGYQAGHDQLDQLMALEHFTFVKVRTPKTAHDYLDRCFEAWLDHVWPQLPAIVGIEVPFRVVLYEDEHVIIVLEGRIDAVDEFAGIWDWKTASQAYEQWQVDRHKVQPTAYTLGLAAELGVDLSQVHAMEFNYAVSYKSGYTRASILTTYRGSGHWEWLVRQARALVELIRADLPTWPLNDSDWHCSPRWCGAWDSCKGAHVNQH